MRLLISLIRRACYRVLLWTYPTMRAPELLTMEDAHEFAYRLLEEFDR